MTEKIYRDKDVDLSVLNGKTLAVIGYGIQGKAQAANARDSGCKVIVGSRPSGESKSQEQAKADGFEAMSIADAVKKADILGAATGRKICIGERANLYRPAGSFFQRAADRVTREWPMGGQQNRYDDDSGENRRSRDPERFAKRDSLRKAGLLD